MAAEITLRSCTAADWPSFVATMVTAFGNEMDDASREQWRRIADPDLMLVASEREAGRETLVGTAGWLPFDLTLPGGEMTVAAVTMVTVRPTHRRRGILRRMMQPPVRGLSPTGHRCRRALGVRVEHLPAVRVRPRPPQEPHGD